VKVLHFLTSNISSRKLYRFFKAFVFKSHRVNSRLKT